MAAADAFARGLEVMDLVYGAGVSDLFAPLAGDPLIDETVTRLFADVWTREGLSLRDRRLLVMGFTASLGRPDLIETQVLGALRNGELDEAALAQMTLFLSYYAGWPNGTAVSRGVGAAISKHRSETAGPA